MWRKRFPEVWAEAREDILTDARAALGHLVPKAIRTQDLVMDLVDTEPSAALRASDSVLDRVLHKPFVAPPHGVRRDIVIRFFDMDDDGSTRGAEVHVSDGEGDAS